jgi:transcriptional regulator with XRE-family HTH domain
MKTKTKKPTRSIEREESGRRITAPIAKSKGPRTGPDSPRSSESVRKLRERFGISRKTFSRVVGFSERAIADWESSKAPSGACLQRIRETSRLQEALARVMRAEYVGTWLETPNAEFGGLKPVEVIERGEVDRIWRMIYQLESGMPT